MSDWNEEDHPRDDDGKFSSGGGGSGESGDEGVGSDGDGDDGDNADKSSNRPSRSERLGTARARHTESVARHSEAKANADASRVELDRLTTEAEDEVRAIKDEASALIAGHRAWKAETRSAEKAAVKEVRQALETADIGFDEDDVIEAAGTRAFNLREAAEYTAAAEHSRQRGDTDLAEQSATRAERARERAQAEVDANPEIFGLPASALSAAERAGLARDRLEEVDTSGLREQLRQATKAEKRIAELREATASGKDVGRALERVRDAYTDDVSSAEASLYRDAAGLPAQPELGTAAGIRDFDADEHARLLRREARAERAVRTHEREVKRLEKAIDGDGDGRVNEEERGLTEAERAETTNLPLAQTKREIWKVEARAAKQLEVDLYDDIGGIALLGGGVTAGSVRAALKGQGEKDVLCRIHSAGGIVTEGLAIYNLFKQHRGKVVCRVDSLAGSIASVIAMAGDELEMAEHSYLMIHNPFGMVQGGASELRSQANLLESMREQMVDIYCAKSGRARDEIGKLMDEETWMTAREALAFGFANRVITDSGAKLAAHVDLSKFAKTPESMRPAASVRVSLGEIQITPNPGTSPQSIADAVQKALGELSTTNPTDAAPVAPETQEIPMAMTEEETKKLADLEAQNAALQAALDAEKGARATAEDALAKSKSKAEMDEEDDEDEEDEEKTAAKAVVDACVAITGVKDIRRLEGAVMALGPRLHGAANAAAARKLQVSQLIASGKLLPAQKAWALKCKPEALEGYLDALGDAKVGPVGEELTPDDEAPEVIKARAATASTFDPTKIELSPSELAIVKQMGENDPKLSERMLTEKRAKAEAEHRAKYGQPRA